MPKNGLVGNVVKKSERVVGDISKGVGKFIGNVVPKSFKKALRVRKTRRRSRKSRKN
jgi:hypothetical protein